MAEIVSLSKFRNAKREAEKLAKAARYRMQFSAEKAEQRRREYEQARMQKQIDSKKVDNDPKFKR